MSSSTYDRRMLIAMIICRIYDITGKRTDLIRRVAAMAVVLDLDVSIREVEQTLDDASLYCTLLAEPTKADERKNETE